MNKEDLIKKWLKNELSDSEKHELSLLDDMDFNAFIITYAQHFKASHNATPLDFKTFKVHYNAKKTTVTSLNWFRPLLKIASVIIVSLGLYFTFFFNNDTLVETLASEKTSIELPDTSIVELNAQSSLTYNSKNWNEKRAIELNGEAYFKVAKGKTFDVKTNSGIVSVVGTAFNVKQRQQYFEVKCYEGVVKVVSDTIIRKLTAGDTYRILHGVFSEGETNDLTPKWTVNMSDFESVPFKQVLAELERQYDIKVTIPARASNKLFTGSFSHNNLEDALIAITEPMQMTYELHSSKQVHIDEK